MRKEYYEAIKNGQTPEQAKNSVGYKVYRGGLLVVQTGALLLKGSRSAALMGSGHAAALAGGAIIGPIAWTYVGLVFIAETGIVSPQLQADLDRLSARSIPVDIVYEQGKEVLGL